jgi:alcohol dehydrogenase YqhD (iron-dependent ADH family)
MKMPDDIWSYFGTWEKFVTDALPCGVLLTLPATGSESSNCAVITNEKIGLKRSLFSNCVRPRFAFLDPETSYSLPPYQTASGAADILAHLMESYFTKVEHVDFTDRLLEGAMRSVLHIAPLAVSQPRNYDVRAELYQAANITNNDVLWEGRIGDWGSHNIEHEISGIYHIAHGAGLAMIFPAWIRYVWKQCPKRFVQWAQRVFDVEYAVGEDEYTVLKAVSCLESFYQSIGLPIRLHEAGIDGSRISEMAKKAMIGVPAVGAQFPLQEEDVKNILEAAL